MEVTVHDLQRGYVNVAKCVMKYGKIVRVRDMVTKEITGFSFCCPDPTAIMLPVGVGRKINTKLAAVETLGMIAGVWPHDLVLKASPQYTSVLLDSSSSYSAQVAYGPRTFAQLDEIVRLLMRDPTSRQAVVTIWNQNDLTRTGDRPCTLTLQFLLRDSRLELHVNMRSQDVWLGLGLDGFLFTQVQLTVARMLGVRAGKYIHHVGSMHIYERDWDRVNELSAPDHHASDDIEWPRRGVVGGRAAAIRILMGESDETNSWYSDRVKQVMQS